MSIEWTLRDEAPFCPQYRGYYEGVLQAEVSVLPRYNDDGTITPEWHVLVPGHKVEVWGTLESAKDRVIELLAL